MKSPQPNSKHCFVCGLSNPAGLRLRFYNTGAGEVTAEFSLPEQYQGYPGIVHGGIVASMLDEAAGRSFMGGDEPNFMFTARLTIRYRRNVPTQTPLRLVGQAGKRSGRYAEATSRIFGPQGDLLAEAEAVLADIPQDSFPSGDLEALGWKIYPEEEGRR